MVVIAGVGVGTGAGVAARAVSAEAVTVKVGGEWSPLQVWLLSPP